LTALVAYPVQGSPAMRDQLEAVKERVQSAFEHFHVDDPLEAAYSLADGLSGLHKLRANLPQEDFDATIDRAMDTYLAQKISDFEEVIARCLGFHLEAITASARLVPGDTTRLIARLWNPRRIAVDDVSIELSLPDDWTVEPEVPLAEQPDGEYMEAVYQFEVPQAAELSCPHWLRLPRSSYAYTLTDTASAGQPFDPPLVEIECTISFGGHQIKLREAAVHKEPIPGGFRALPLAIVPPISLQPRSSQQFLRVQPEDQHLLLQVTVRNNNTSGRISGTLTLETPAGWQVEHNHVEITLEQVGDSTALQFHLTVPADTQPGRYVLRYVVKSAARDYDVILNPVRMGPPGVPHEPDAANCVREEFVIAPAIIHVHIVDVEFTQGLRYAYVRGADEDILETLSQMDVRFDLLSDDDIDFTDLSEYDAIVIGPNAYLIRDELVKNSGRFVAYVEQGGTLIVQYQGYGYQNHDFTPYWFEYNQPHDRVTWENAPINILQPEHFLMNLPNSIGEKDFENWVHDRGLYFFGKWDKQYIPILSCSDLNEAPRDGGLLVTSYGRGTYAYVGYSLFRQLPAGVTGAFRLFANLLALPVGRLLRRKEFLREVSLFSFMNDEQLEAVARSMTERTEEDSVYLARAGDTGSELYIIVQGEVEIIRESGTTEHLLTTFGVGACIGEISVLVSSPRTAAMRTKGTVDLLVLNGSDFQFLIQEYPNMAYRVIQMLAQRLVTLLSSLNEA
jgi:hypothetical protein